MKDKIEKIFNITSILFISIFIINYIGRFIYYYKDSKTTKVYSNNLSKYIRTDKDRYTLDTTIKNINNKVIYSGKVNNNYVKYQGYLWRIVRVNENNSITLVTEDTITNLSFNNILDWLNKKEKNTGIFENTIDTSILVDNIYCSNIIEDINKIKCNNETIKIGILSIEDYVNSGSNNGFLNNNTEYWLSNSKDENINWYINTEGKISSKDKSSKLGIRPVITINKDTKIIKGIGTYENPYIIENRTIKTTNDVLPGEYILYNDNIWHVISKDKTIKVAQLECIKNNDECISTYYSKTNNLVKNNNVIKYLNNTYYNSLPNKEYLEKDIYYTGYYSLNNNDYKAIYSSSVTNYVGMLNISDIYYNEVANTLLITPSTTNDLSIFSINNNNQLYENMVTTKLYIRPSINLKPNIEIIGGNGTINKPYKLGGLK